MELPPATDVGLPSADHAADPGEHAGSVAVDRDGDGVRVDLVGEIDVEMKDELFDALEEAARHGAPVEVHCAGVTFIDSTGISGLAWLAQLASEPPCLVAVPPVMYELLQLTGMYHVFRFAT
jgi:anti-anti-sigma factor